MSTEVESGVTHLPGTRRALDRATLHAGGFAGLSPAHLSVGFAPDVEDQLLHLELEEILDDEPRCEVKPTTKPRGERCGRTPVEWAMTCPACQGVALTCEPCHQIFLYWLSTVDSTIIHGRCGRSVNPKDIRWSPI